MVYVLTFLGVALICFVIRQVIIDSRLARQRVDTLSRGVQEQHTRARVSHEELMRLRQRAMALRDRWIAEGYLTKDQPLEFLINNVDPLVFEEMVATTEATIESAAPVDRTRVIDLS